MTLPTIAYSGSPLEKRDYIALVLLLGLALMLRLIRLFDLDLTFDEVVLLFLAQHSYTEIWNLCKLDNFPPLFPWLVKLWTTVSWDVNWFRLLGALLGSLTPPAAYLLGRQLSNRKLGWLLGLAAAGSVSLIFYSQYVRMYNLQPLGVCLSLLWFTQALKTDRWRYWVLTALANLIGFYLYIFMIFVVAAEFLVLVFHCRLNWKKYLHPLWAHLPFVIGVLVWLGPALSRYSQIEQEYWILPFSLAELVKLWTFLGTGVDYRDRYWLAFLLNLPFLFGFLRAVVLGMKNEVIRNFSAVFIMVIVFFAILSLSGQSFFFKRYFIYLLPIYLALALAGWFYPGTKSMRRLAAAWIAFSLIFSLVYYYVDYYKLHDYYGFVRPWPYAEKNEGHALSQVAHLLSDRLGHDEVIIHYSSPNRRVCSYFASLFYHQRRLPEYLYSHDDLRQFDGRQYLRAGERLASLWDLHPLPLGIWVVTLDLGRLFQADSLAGESPWHTGRLLEENLAEDLRQAGYQKLETLSRGLVQAIHLRRDAALTSSSPNL